MERPLENLRILSVTGALLGPFCSMIFGDLGAEVIKIERPGFGDMSREWGPFFPNVKGPDRSGYFVSVNRNQKSVTLNLKDPKGRDVLRELVVKSDIIIENFKPGTMDEWDLGYDALSKINPSLIYACGSGFGHTGPYSKYPSYDILGQAMSGFMDMNGWPDKPPGRAGSSIGDIITGTFLACGIFAALNYRYVTGLGQKVDVAQVDSMLAVLENAIMRYTLEGKSPSRIGSRHPNITPFDIFRAKDGWLVIAVGNDGIWKRFCNTLGKPEWIQDQRFISNSERCANEPLLKGLIEEYTLQKTRMEVAKMLLENDVPSGPVYSVGEACEDPQTLSRDMIVEYVQPQFGKVKAAGCPVKYSRTPIKVFKPAPLLGEHTDEVLGGLLGYSSEKIADLRKESII